MAVTVSVELGYEWGVRAKAAEVFALVADVPASASHYPSLARLQCLGEGVYRWEMEPIAVGSLQMQTVYTCRYHANARQRRVHWEPADGTGDNAHISGSWTIQGHRSWTEVRLDVQAQVDLPAPSLAGALLAPLVQAQLEALTERYIERLIARWGGEVALP